jgi:hypothetical protein
MLDFCTTFYRARCEGRYKSFEHVKCRTLFLPSGIGERYGQTISILCLAAPLRRYELPLYKRNAELILWALYTKITIITLSISYCIVQHTKTTLQTLLYGLLRYIVAGVRAPIRAFFRASPH